MVQRDDLILQLLLRVEPFRGLGVIEQEFLILLKLLEPHFQCVLLTYESLNLVLVLRGHLVEPLR